MKQAELRYFLGLILFFVSVFAVPTLGNPVCLAFAGVAILVVLSATQHLPKITNRCWVCGMTYHHYGETCGECIKKCNCRWDLGCGPNLNCPIHGHNQDEDHS